MHATPLAEYCAPGTRILERMLPLPHERSLRLVSFYPSWESRFPPVVMVPGLVSVMLTFKPILLELTRDFVVHYLETSDKPSSVLPQRSEYSVSAIGADIVDTIAHLDLPDRGYSIFASSLGATATIDAFDSLAKQPCCLLLLEPNGVFDYPAWSLVAVRVLAPVYPLARPVAKWYMKHFRVNYAEDAEMYRITSRALDTADPYRLKNTILAISSYRIWDRLANVTRPTLVVCASKDTFHRQDDIRRIVNGIPGSTRLDLEVHARTHSAEIVQHVRVFIESLQVHHTRSPE